MPHVHAAGPAPSPRGIYRERVIFLLVATGLVLAAHVADILQAHGPNWPALVVRVLWAASLLVNALVVQRAGLVAIRWVTGAASLAVAPFYLALILVTGGAASPRLPFVPVLVVLLPIILPEMFVLAACSSTLLAGGTLAILAAAGEPPGLMLACLQVGVFAIITSVVVARAHLRTQIAMEHEGMARQEALAQNEGLVGELREALANVKTLKGLVPVCAWCHRIRNDRGYWEQMEAYVRDHTEADFSHGICPECTERMEARGGPPPAAAGARPLP